MSNLNDPKNYSREVRQDAYNDANGQTHVTRTDTTVNNPDSYQDGYVQGRVEENRYQENVLVDRDNDNAARGLLLGILLTSLAALTAGAIWYFNQRNEVPDPVAPTIVVPNRPDPSPSPQVNQPPKQETTIIERTREVPVPVPVPQQQAPSPQAPAPDINISVPNSVTQPPATQPAPSSTETQEPSSTTDTNTPAQGTSTPTDTNSDSNSSTNNTDTNTGSPTNNTDSNAGSPQ